MKKKSGWSEWGKILGEFMIALFALIVSGGNAILMLILPILKKLEDVWKKKK